MRVTVRVRPGTSRPRVGGNRDGALLIAVNEPAVDGRATTAALKALAKALRVPQRSVVLVSGATGRTKVVEVPDDAAVTIDRLLDA